jgi:hypothetical protein
MRFPWNAKDQESGSWKIELAAFEEAHAMLKQRIARLVPGAEP